jgi:ABC-type antimicrobial peptide transport system permease subunit
MPGCFWYLLQSDLSWPHLACMPSSRIPVGQHTQEIGVRIAIGATGADIMNTVFKLGMFPVGIGLMLGLAASLVVNPVLRSQLAGVSTFDPLTLLAAIAVLVFTAFLGCWIPAYRATPVDPVVALRHE